MKKLIFIFFTVLFFNKVNAQSLAINTDGSTADASSILDVKSTSKGILIPRMDKTERNAIATPVNGLLVFQHAPDSAGFYFYNSGSWVWLQNTSGAGSGWSITGNAGTDTSVNFIGTTDLMPLRFKINSQKSGIIDFENAAIGYESMRNRTHGIGNAALGRASLYNNNGGFNTAIGAYSLFSDTTGQENTAIGSSSMLLRTHGSANTALGGASLFRNKGNFNTAIGSYSLYSDTTGQDNTAIGYTSMYLRTHGFQNVALGRASLFRNKTDNNVAIGAYSLYSDTTGFENTAIGFESMRNRTHGFQNVALGDASLYTNKGNFNTAIGGGSLFSDTTGNDNTAIGSSSMRLRTHGSGNVALGSSTLYRNKADFNTAIGSSSLYNNIVGSGNVAVGYQAGYNETNSDKLYIENSNANKDNALIYGDFAGDSLNLNGKINIRDFTRLGTQASGAPAIKLKKLTTTLNASGNGSVVHGLTESKIVGLQVRVTNQFNSLVFEGNNIANNSFNAYINAGSVVIQGVAGSIGDIVNRPVTIIITYEE